MATLQETVTVTGASPVIDTTATSVQQNFKVEQLNNIPNGRDMWALLAATPGVVMSRIDVGRQSRRHADRLHRLWPQRPGARLGRGHQHDGRHRRRRLLLRLRLVRGSVPRRRRPGRRSGDSGRAVAVPRQVGRQHLRRRVLHRRLQQLVPGLEPVGRDDHREPAASAAATKCCATTTSTSTPAVR